MKSRNEMYGSNIFYDGRSSILHEFEFEDVDGMYPKYKCNQCNRRMWIITEDSNVWECYYCGNMFYYTYGKIWQQIDAKRAAEELSKYKDKRRLNRINISDLKVDLGGSDDD